MPDQISRKELADLHSEEVQEIVGRAPNGLIRWGISSFFFVLIIFLVVSWMIKYSDTVSGSLTLTAFNSPKPIVAKTGGKLVRLFAQEGSQLNKNEVLGFIESTAIHEEVLQLSEVISDIWDTVLKDQWASISISPEKYKNLGELQGAFQSFYSNYIQINTFLSRDLYNTKKLLLKEEMRNNDSLKSILNRQQEIHEKDFAIAENDYRVQDILYRDSVVALFELKQEESKLLSKKLPLENMKASIINNYSTSIAKEKELLELEKQFMELKYGFMQALNSLSSDLENWKKQYVLSTPVKGTVMLPGIIQENQELIAGQEVFYIAPDNNKYYGQLLVDQTNFGKVAVGQQVLIKLSSFPFQEYGKLKGVISFISGMPNKDNQFVVKVDLPDDLRTDNGHTITFSNGLVADAEIITKKTRLIYKFFYTLKEMMNKSSKSTIPKIRIENQTPHP